MVSPALAIMRTVVSTLRADTTNFSDINGYVIGETFPNPPIQRYPICEVVITDEREQSRGTGEYWRELEGFIRFSAQIQDIISFDANDTYEVGSYIVVYDLIQATIELMSSNTNRALGGLTFDNGGIVQEFIINTSATYGIGERSDNFEMQAVVPFTVLTKESRDFS